MFTRAAVRSYDLPRRPRPNQRSVKTEKRNTVATGLLAVIHCLVSFLEHCAGRLGIDWKARNADRRADLHLFSARTVRMETAEVRGGDARSQSFRALDCTRLFSIGKHHAELIAPIARHDFARIARRGPQQLRKLPQKRIPLACP
jgi:hypothetical protein